MVTPIRPLPRQQRGAALLVMMLVVLVAATTVLVSRLDVTDARTRQQTDAQEALAIVRGALIDYAATRPDFFPGAAVTLPCPDIDDSGGWPEGEAHTDACGGVGETVIGRVPWRTLGIEPPKDSSGACLWYVVSGSYKDAATATSTLVNPDSNGQLQLFGIEATSIVAGAAPQDRPIAMLLAPMSGLDGQVRAAPSGAGRQCSASFDPAEFLDEDVASGISNAALAGAADVVDIFAAAAGYDPLHNDRVALISRTDLASVVQDRHDFDANLRSLGFAVAACVADYARHNPASGPPGGGPPGGGPPGGGPPGRGPGGEGPPGQGPDGNGPPGQGPDGNGPPGRGGGGPPGRGPPGGGPPGLGDDHRLPWPAPLGLSDYRVDSDYDDVDAGVLSGRLPDVVDDSSAATGNPVNRILTDCDPTAVPEWSAVKRSMWRNWKDHFFYAVAESFAPSATTPSSCTTCLTVNGSGQYAAVVLLAGGRLPALGQVRNAPPIDADTRDNAVNYLEAGNPVNFPYAGGVVDFTSQPPGDTFNDMLFCIDDALTVTEC
jgi:hypothetical protein